MIHNSNNPNHPAAGESIKVGPIRRLEDIKAIKKLLADKPRDLALFTIGINTNLRGSDLLDLKIGQVRYMKVDDGLLAERKRPVTMNSTVHAAIQKLLASIPEGLCGDDQYLFQSKKGKGQKLISSTLSNMVKQWCADIGFVGNYGAESLRKTFGYHQLVTFDVDVRTIMTMFGYNSRRKLFEYLCVQESEMKKTAGLKEL